MNNQDRETPRILLAIPVFNEQEYIHAVLDQVAQYIDDILVIDDGSTDRSRMLLAERSNISVISHPRNQGYGKTIIDAFSYARCSRYDWVITMDCDLQHEPARIPDFIAAIVKDNTDIISGSRYLPESLKTGRPPTDRQNINENITALVNDKFGLGITDAFCGFKAHRVEAVSRMNLKEVGYGVPLEFWVQVAANHLRVREIPVSLIYNDPNRHFGGELDDPETRLMHYQMIFDESLEAAGLS